MTTIQYIVVALTVLLNAMDGFDVLSIAFASPGIAAEWGIPSSGLGVVLSMELIGMAFGSVLLGGVADKIGRRPTLIGCLCVMAIGMVGVAAAAVNPVVLSIWRIFTGLGIGGMLSATNAVVSEFSNNRRRKFCISMMVIGYPLGAGIGGLYASNLIGPYGWRAVFYFGAAITSLLLPAIILFVPESVHWLARKQPANALERINASLKKVGHETISALPALPTHEAKKSIGDIFSPALRMTTILVTLGYFLRTAEPAADEAAVERLRAQVSRGEGTVRGRMPVGGEDADVRPLEEPIHEGHDRFAVGDIVSVWIDTESCSVFGAV